MKYFIKQKNKNQKSRTKVVRLISTINSTTLMAKNQGRKDMKIHIENKKITVTLNYRGEKYIKEFQFGWELENWIIGLEG